MNGYMGGGESFRRPSRYCPVCLRKLQHNIGFSILERYKAIRDICQEFGWMKRVSKL
jgi:hypothetical protein